MAKFLSFNVTNTGAPTTEGETLINVDQISALTYVTATGVLTVELKNTATSQIAFLLSTSNAGAAAVPAITAGTPTIQTVNRALTANPGGVKASVGFGKDQTGGVPAPGQGPLTTNLQIFVNTVTYTA
tara:strand:- start:80 stop:463 length:384 start_codon:yes stop_codon:yes gene_type:complete